MRVYVKVIGQNWKFNAIIGKQERTFAIHVQSYIHPSIYSDDLFLTTFSSEYCSASELFTLHTPTCLWIKKLVAVKK